MLRKLMMLAAMLAMVLLVAAPAMAQTEGDNNIVEECAAVLNQINEGSQYAENTADQDLNQDQYQYNPGAAGGDVQYNPQFQVDDGNSLQQTPVIDVEDDPNVAVQYGEAGEGGAGGTGSQYQYGTQDQTQDATATGPTFSAEQQQYCENVVEQAAAAAVGEEAAAGAVTAGGTAAGAAVGAPGAAGGAAAGGAAGGGGGGGALPATGGISLLTLGAGALLVGGGLVARRFVR